MATFNPQYVNLDRYEAAQLARRANQVSPLDALLQGAQQGLELQQLPGRLRDQALARQLQNALNNQKLMDLQNPEAALQRELREAAIRQQITNPFGGVVQSPLGANVVATPNAINQTASELEQSMNIAPDQAVPSAAPGLPITPIGTTGFSMDPNIPIAENNRKATESLNDRLALLNARPVQNILVPGAEGYGVVPKSGDATFTPLVDNEGKPVMPKPTGSSRTSSGRGLTPNAQQSLMLKYGKVSDIVGDLNDPKLLGADGGLDFAKLAVEVGKAERINELAELKTKEAGLSALQKKDNAGFIAAKKDLINLKSKVNELSESGREPGMLQNMLAAQSANPSTGPISSFFRQLSNMGLNEDTIQKEALRAGLDSAVTKALSGLAVTSPEAIRLSPLIPQKDDSLKIILQKTAELEDFLTNRIEGNNESAGIIAPTTTTAPVRVNSKAERDALPAGTVYISPSGAISTR